jgi:hypothetical protein
VELYNICGLFYVALSHKTVVLSHSTSWHVLVLHSFGMCLECSISLCKYTTNLVYSSIHKFLCCFHFLANNAAINIFVQLFVWMFSNVLSIFSGGESLLHTVTLFSYQAASQSDYVILYSHQQYTGVPVSLILTHICNCFSLVTAILLGVKSYLIVVLLASH